jgi:hypothetical protein
MCENQDSGPPKVLDSTIDPLHSLEDIIEIAKASLQTAMVPGTSIWAGVGTGAVFIRVVELNEVGEPTERLVFKTTLAELG